MAFGRNFVRRDMGVSGWAEKPAAAASAAFFEPGKAEMSLKKMFC